MGLNSCLYETEIMHHRLSPKEHRFSYRFFSFYLDLEEIDEVVRRVFLFSRNKLNAYSFFDKDHLEIGGQSIKENILLYLKEQGIDLAGGRIMLLTYVRTFGYVFNPVSFYYCFDKAGHPVCVVAQIGNTFGELKAFLIRGDKWKHDRFKDRQDKFYYISPFTQLDDQLDFKLAIPDQHLNVMIDTSKSGKKVILTAMMGNKKPLDSRQLCWLTLKFPFVTLKVITLIHWHALLLWFKSIPHEEKTSNMHLQKEVHRVWGKDVKLRGFVRPEKIRSLR